MIIVKVKLLTRDMDGKGRIKLSTKEFRYIKHLASLKGTKQLDYYFSLFGESWVSWENVTNDFYMKQPFFRVTKFFYNRRIQKGITLLNQKLARMSKRYSPIPKISKVLKDIEKLKAQLL